MNNWSDFEKFVFTEFKGLRKDVARISDRISNLEGRAATWGAIAGALAAAVGEAVVKLIWKN